MLMSTLVQQLRLNTCIDITVSCTHIFYEFHYLLGYVLVACDVYSNGRLVVALAASFALVFLLLGCKSIVSLPNFNE